MNKNTETTITLPVPIGGTVYTIRYKSDTYDWYGEYQVYTWTVTGYEIRRKGLSAPGVWTARGFEPVTTYAQGNKYYVDLEKAEEALEHIKRAEQRVEQREERRRAKRRAKA